MQLTYTGVCPKGWNAPGFKACTDPNLIVGLQGATGRRAQSLDTGHHGVQISLFNNNLRTRNIIDSSSTAIGNVVDAVDKTLVSLVEVLILPTSYEHSQTKSKGVWKVLAIDTHIVFPARYVEAVISTTSYITVI